MLRPGRNLGVGAALFALLTILRPAVTQAELPQPDGTVIPQCNFIPCLYDLFLELGEALDWFEDSSDKPKTFKPAGAITITVTQIDAYNKNTFGWYNVGDTSFNGTPTLYPLVGCGSGEGTVIQKDFSTEPAYMGGDIGFFLIAPTEVGSEDCADLSNIGRIYYTEDDNNTDAEPGMPHYYHHVVYPSTLEPESFYFCFEDQVQGGDNDFNDLVIRVDGIKSLCWYGECFGGQTCVDGFCVSPCVYIDCDDNTVCDPYGECVDRSCYSNIPVLCGEFGMTCWNEECIPHPCFEIWCDWGLFCRDGACYPSCAGIICPNPNEVCNDGVCLPDLCFGLICELGYTCRDGLCILDNCVDIECRPGRACNPVSGLCEDTMCLKTYCPEGQVCSLGQCVAYIPPPVDPPDAGPYVPPDYDPYVSDDGCGCQLSAGVDPLAGISLLSALFLGVALLRLRRGRR